MPHVVDSNIAVHQRFKGHRNITWAKVLNLYPEKMVPAPAPALLKNDQCPSKYAFQRRWKCGLGVTGTQRKAVQVNYGIKHCKSMCRSIWVKRWG